MAENGNDRESYKKPKRPYKVAFAGVYSVGKTSLFKRMFKLDFSEEKKPFCHPKLTHQEIFDDDKTIIPLEIWDTADMEKHDDESITQSYYRGCKFVLLVYSAVDEYSLHRLSGIADDVKAYEPSAKLILVKNKIDLPVSSDTIPEEKEKAFRREIKKKVIANFSTSAKTPQGVDELLKYLAKYSLKLFKRKRECSDDEENVDPFRLDEGNERNEKGCCG